MSHRSQIDANESVIVSSQYGKLHRKSETPKYRRLEEIQRADLRWAKALTLFLRTRFERRRRPLTIINPEPEANPPLLASAGYGIDLPVAFPTEGDEIRFGIIAEPTSRRDVMSLKSDA
jgi:hypothetical protein